MRIVVYVKQIDYRERFVYPHQGFDIWINSAFDKRQVGCIRRLVQISNKPKLSMDSLYGAFGDAFDKAFRTAAVMDEICNCTNLEVVLYGKLNQIRKTGHAAI